MEPFGTTAMEDRVYASDEGSTMSVVAQGTRQRARVICNPSSGGGSCDPSRLREQLSGLEFDWIETKGQGDAREAAEEWDEGLLVSGDEPAEFAVVPRALKLIAGPGYRIGYGESA